ncbi:MAG: hypothetical protein LAP85_18355 [Acidobacteriia bacterium]|nr:hypothetical protein [Terriglobia bacterium]
MRKTTGRRIAAVPVLLILLLLLAGCVQKTINQIMAEPYRYANREVGIVGKVVRSYSALGRGAYEVDDGTGKLWVVSDKGVPRTGARVAVRGKIKDGFDLGSIVKLPNAISSGLVLIESSHRAH